MARFSIETVFRAVDKMSAPMTRMQARIARVTRVAGEGVRRLSDSTEGLNKRLATIGRRSALAITGTTAAALAGMTLLNASLTRSTKAAKELGVEIGVIDGITGRVQDAGLGFDGVAQSIRTMNQRLGEAATVGEMAGVTEGLFRLGLRYGEIRQLAPQDQFIAILQAAQDMGDGQKATAAVTKILGEEAAKMVGVLRTQEGSIRDMIAAEAQLDFVTDQARAGAERWTRAVNAAGDITGSLSNQVAGLAGVHMSHLVEQFVNFARVNRDVINSRLEQFFQTVVLRVQWLRENFDRVARVLRIVGTLFAAWVAFSVTLKVITGLMTAYALAVKGVALAVKAWQLISKAALAVQLAINAAMIANPVAVVVIAVVALVAALVELTIGWENVGAILSRVWDSLREGWSALVRDFNQSLDWFVGIPGRIVAAWDGLGDFFSGLLDPISQRLDTVVEKFSGLSDLVGKVGSLFTGDTPEPSVTGPAERAEASRSETLEKQTAVVKVKAEPGTSASMTTSRPSSGIDLTLESSGAFV